MNDPRRLFRYVLAFAGLLTVLYAVTGLLGLALTTLTLQSSTLSGGEDTRIRASLYLAELIIGLPIWLALWISSQRRARASLEERNAPERRFFLGAVFACTSIVALFALHSVLRYVLTLPGTGDADHTAQDTLFSAARLLVFGAAWVYYAHLGWCERNLHDEDALHDLAVYLLAGFSLAFLAVGVTQAISQILTDLVGATRTHLLAGSTRSVWDRWGSIAALILSGGLLWGAIWQYDLSRGGARPVRVGYLYIILLIAVPWALASAGQGLFELLLRLFDYSPEWEPRWSFVKDFLPALLVAGMIWVHHWAVIRRQAAPRRRGERHVPGSVLWPRRPGLVLMTVLGLAIVVPALVSVLWLALDFLLNTDDTLSGENWWRDRLSASIAAAVVGTGAWLGGWVRLQRAAATAPEIERAARERRQALGLVVLVSSLAAIGFGVSLLWLILQPLLGAGLDSTDVSRMLKYLSAATIALGVLAYHGQALRRDLAFGPARAAKVRIIALVAAGMEEELERLRETTGRRIEVIGYLSEPQNDAWTDLPTLENQLTELGAPETGQGDRAILLLGCKGGSLHSYSHRRT